MPLRRKPKLKEEMDMDRKIKMKIITIVTITMLLALLLIGTIEATKVAEANENKPDASQAVDLQLNLYQPVHIDGEDMLETLNRGAADSPPLPKPPTDISQVVNDTTPELNILNPKHPDYGKIPLPRYRRAKLTNATPSPGEGDYATIINGDIVGAFAIQEVQLALELPSAPPDRTLYAPTLMPPNNAPLESVTWYRRYAGWDTTGRDWGVWDHTKTPPGFVVLKPINHPTFLSKYIRSRPEGQVYYTAVWNINNVWEALLYNFNTGYWERQYSLPSSSKSNFQHGWDAFETYFDGTCPALPNIESIELQVLLNNSGWRYVTPSYGSLQDTQNCAYAENMISQYYHWSVGP